MLVAFVSLRYFTLGLTGDQLHLSEKYLQYITKASHQAPHLEFFTIQYVDDYTFRCKRVNANWVVYNEGEYPAPWEYVCVLSKGSMFVHDLFFRYLYLQRKTDKGILCTVHREYINIQVRLGVTRAFRVHPTGIARRPYSSPQSLQRGISRLVWHTPTLIKSEHSNKWTRVLDAPCRN